MRSPCNEKSGRFFLNTAEMEAVLSAAKEGRYGARDYAICRLMIRHGFRASELCSFSLDHLDINNDRHAQIFVARKKCSHSMWQPISGDSLRALNAWLRVRPKDAGSGEVFLSERGTPLRRRSLYYLVKSWGDRALIPFVVHPHMLRHTMGYVMANSGAGFRQMQDLLGHKNPTHTYRYTQLDRSQYENVWGDF